MGFYSRFIFPWVLDHAMQRPPFAAQRPIALSEATGEVLEIGFGTGLNLPHYPASVRRIVAVEPAGAVSRRAAHRIADSQIDTQLLPLRADGTLPLDAGRFDSAVSTWTMCSIPNVPSALREIHRVLRPGGRLLFIEHGLAPDPAVQRWQHRLNPVVRYLGDGCNLDRDITALLRSSPLELQHCETFYLPNTPKVGAYTYRGAAIKT